MKTIVIIPSYNASKTISDLVKQILKMNLETIVIDDGSEDETAQIASRAGAFVIRHPDNTGKGASLRDGFDLALKKNCDGVVILDSDGQHNPQEIIKFLKGAEITGADIIVGNRMASAKDMPFIRLATNKIMSFIVSGICKKKIYDTQCGFKFIRSNVLRNIKLNSQRYEIDSELLIKASRKKFKIESIPINCIYNKQITSNIKYLSDTANFFKLLFALIFENG